MFQYLTWSQALPGASSTTPTLGPSIAKEAIGQRVRSLSTVAARSPWTNDPPRKTLIALPWRATRHAPFFISRAEPATTTDLPRWASARVAHPPAMLAAVLVEGPARGRHTASRAQRAESRKLTRIALP